MGMVLFYSCLESGVWMGETVFSLTITGCHLKALLMLFSLLFIFFPLLIQFSGTNSCRRPVRVPVSAAIFYFFFLCALMSSQIKNL